MQELRDGVCAEEGGRQDSMNEVQDLIPAFPLPPSSFVSLRIPCSFNPLSSFNSFEFLLTICCIVQVAHACG